MLDLACTLFNEGGAERVTTRLIAKTAGINEGNLYYYFRTKEALVLALFGRFESAAVALLEFSLPTTVVDPTPFAHMLRGWFLLSWEFRFLFQDVLFLQKTMPTLHEPLRVLTERLTDATRAVFFAMRDADLIVISAEDLECLLTNLWIVSTYWISSLVLHKNVRLVTPQHLRWGYEQVRSLYKPYLTPAVRAWIEQNPVSEMI